MNSEICLACDDNFWDYTTKKCEEDCLEGYMGNPNSHACILCISIIDNCETCEYCEDCTG